MSGKSSIPGLLRPNFSINKEYLAEKAFIENLLLNDSPVADVNWLYKQCVFWSAFDHTCEVWLAIIADVKKSLTEAKPNY